MNFTGALKGCVLGLAVITSSAMATPATPSLVVEKEKWANVGAVFAQQLNVSQTAGQKIGAFMKNHSASLSISLGVIGSAVLYCSFPDKFVALTGKPIAWILECFIKPADLKGSTAETVVVNAITFTALALPTLALTSLLYLVNAYVGKWIEAKPTQCLQALTNFVSQLDVCRDQIPQSLVPAFDLLAKDLASNGKLTVITAAQAQGFVEGLVAFSMTLGAVA